MKAILLAIVFSSLCLAADRRIRVEVYSSGDSPWRETVDKLFVKSLEAIDDVITVSKEPDYIVALKVVKSLTGTDVAVSIEVQEVTEDGIAAVLLERPQRPQDVQNFQAVLRSIARTVENRLVVGAPEMLSDIAATLVAAVNKSTLANERKCPHGESDAEERAKNFFCRMEARPVTQSVK